MAIPKHPFEATPAQVRENLDSYVEVFVAELQSFFEVMPRGTAFVSYEAFVRAYEVLAARTLRFSAFSRGTVLEAVRENSLVLVILRTILGFTPPELAHMTSVMGSTPVTQNVARRIDQLAREEAPLFGPRSSNTQKSAVALAETAVALILRGASNVAEGLLHRLDQIDTSNGLDTVARAANEGVPYPRLLYERLLGRPFAGHRDSVSEKVGQILEDAVVQVLEGSGIPYYKTGVAERFEDMDQAPDFFVPSKDNPTVLIEAKIAEDDGTARDKVTRIQHLAELQADRARRGFPAFELVACVDGRGFGIRRSDVGKLLEATQGKLFTLATVRSIVSCTQLRRFSSSGTC